MFATSVQGLLYKYVAKPIFFRKDPEKVHDHVIRLGKWLGEKRIARFVISFFLKYENEILSQDVLGIHFQNPVGLAAGFDKNAELYRIIPSVGFGFEEVGSITGEYCEGNPKPRLWRHPDIQSLRVYYGLKNDGATQISKRLSKKRFTIPIGVSVAKTNCKETISTDAAIKDYIKCYTAFSSIGDYDTINISCPNAHGGQPFSDPERLGMLLSQIHEHRSRKPVFIKLSPDLSLDEVRDIATMAKKYSIDGLICSNLVKKHDLGKGGLSGKPVAAHSLELLSYLYKNFSEDFVFISCGGVFTGEDAYERIRHGASLVQLITGMIYGGPQVVGEINRDLAMLLKQDGFEHISEAVGLAHH